MSGLISVEEARKKLLEGLSPLSSEVIPLGKAGYRILASDLTAKRTQPPFDASAMDGYAVRASDIGGDTAALKIIGEAPAGHQFSKTVQPGECVRIFTGAPLPHGTDTILIQENATKDTKTGHILPTARPAKGTYVRPAGLDFKEGDTRLKHGNLLTPAKLSLAAAMDHAELSVIRKPRVAVLATGDELTFPGEIRRSDQIVSSNSFGVIAAIEKKGATTIDLGIAKDTRDALATALNAAKNHQADMLITLGGASVGDHDLVQDSLVDAGMSLDFWRIAMRPGKPLMAGRLDDMTIVGLPGNPVSSLVCTLLFVLPAIDKMLMGSGKAPEQRIGQLGRDLCENDQREDYLRSQIKILDGVEHIIPFEKQDSSMLATLADSDALLIRPPFAPAIKKGSPVSYLDLHHV